MTFAAHAPEFDAALITRYETVGPRYTSYPTVPQFRSDFGEPALRDVIRLSNEEPIPRPLSLYVHIPFCTSPCFFCGCNRIITRDLGKADLYLKRLRREIALTAPLFDRDRPVLQLHFGGGTPNFIDLPRMRALMDTLRQNFSFISTNRREYGIEVDPRFIDADQVRGLAELGFNRLSIGIQDFDPQVQQAVNRIQSEAKTREVVESGRGAGFSSISVDLIYGLPRQTPAGFEQTLGEVVALLPDRVAVYAYAHLPHLFKAQRHMHADDLPDPTTRLQLFGLAFEKLCGAGYVYIGMDHFARAQDDLTRAQGAKTLQRNFQGYSTHGECDIIGLGVSAIGRIGDSYSQNAHGLGDYYTALDSDQLPVTRGLLLDRDDIIRRELIGELMCHGELDMQAFSLKYRLVFNEYFSLEMARIRALTFDGLVTLGSRMITVTPRGRLLLRNIAMCFDAYLDGPRSHADYSQTI